MSRENTNPVEFWENHVRPRINYMSVLRSLNPKEHSTYFEVECPGCRQHEAFCYKGSQSIVCNRKNKCSYSASLLEWVAGSSSTPKGKEFVDAVRKVAEDSGISCDEISPLNFSSGGVPSLLEEPKKEFLPPEKNPESEVQKIFAHYISYCHRALMSDEGKRAREYLDSRGVTDPKKFAIGFYASTEDFRKILQKEGCDLEVATDLGLLSLDGRLPSRYERYLAFPWKGGGAERDNIINIYHRWADKNLPDRKSLPAWLGSRVKRFEEWQQRKSTLKGVGEFVEPKIPKMLGLHGRGTGVPFHFYFGKKSGLLDHRLVVEGVLDAIVALQHGVHEVCATLTAQISGDQLDLVAKEGAPVYLLLDPDPAGRDGSLNSVGKLLERGVKTFVVDPEFLQGLDPDEFILKFGVERFRKYKDQGKHALKHVAQELIARHKVGSMWTDATTASALAEAEAFARRNFHPSYQAELDVMFWKTLVASGLNKDLVKMKAKAVAPTNHKGASQKFSSGEFKLKDDGLYVVEESVDGEPAEKWVCGRLDIFAGYRDFEGNGWGRVLRFKDGDGTQHEIYVPMEKLADRTNPVVQELLKGGLEIGISDWNFRQVIRYINTVRPEETWRMVKKGGWYHDSFALPNSGFSASSEKIIVNNRFDESRFFQTKGSLADWQKNVGIYTAHNTRLLLAASLAFVPPLLRPLGKESFGIHFFDSSSVGKSTVSTLVGSICGGDGKEPFHLSWNTTINALEGLAERFNDGLMILDEISQVRAAAGGNIVYMLANGKGKARSDRGLGVREIATWKVCVLSTGEVQLASKLAEEGIEANAGQEVRLIEIPARASGNFGIFDDIHTAASGKELSDRLMTNSLRFYGVPLRKFLEELVREKEKWISSASDLHQNIYKNLLDNIEDRSKVDGQVHRVMDKFSLIATAGELAVTMGILPVAPGQPTRGVQRCFEDWLANRPSNVEASEPRKILSRVRLYLQQFGLYQFPKAGETDWEDEEGVERRPKISGFRRENGDFCVFREVMEKEICRGLNINQVKKYLASAGFLQRDKAGKFTVPVKPPGQEATQRMYLISSSILTSDPDRTEEDDAVEELVDDSEPIAYL